MVPPRLAEDDEFDDLDDVLDQFSPAPTKAQPPAPPPSATQPNSTAPSSSGAALPNDINEGDEIAEDFARELAKGMESLMLELGGKSSVSGTAVPLSGAQTEEEKESERAFKAAWETMLVEGMNDASENELTLLGDMLGPSGPQSKAAQPDLGPGGTGDYQSAIRQAREKLKESDSKLKADVSADATDPLEALLSQLGNADQGESDEDFKGMLELMMGQLMSKEVLYEPLKELHEKFPAYLKDNAATIAPEDKTRYESQIKCIEKVMLAFDDPKHDDSDPAQSARIVELMSEMQTFGSPPSEIMGDLPPGFGMGTDGMPEMPEGCVIA